MKTKIIILLVLIVCVVRAQLETNTAVMNKTGVQSRSCHGVSYKSDGVANFKPTNGLVYFFSSTNIVTFTVPTNLSDRVEWDCVLPSQVVTNGCGTNMFSITNPAFVGAGFRMTLYKNTNHAFMSSVSLISDGLTNQ